MMQYLLKQPSSLENLAMEKVAVWTAMQAKHFLAQIWEMHQHDNEMAAKEEAAVTQHVGNVREHIGLHLPMVFHDALLSKAIFELGYLYKKAEYEHSLDKIKIDRRVIKRMLESFLTENITSLILNYYQFTAFQEPLLAKSYLLTNLTRLDLDFKELAINMDKNTAIYKLELSIITLLQNLPKLKYLTIKYVCTDNILRCISHKCKRVEELDIYASIEINNKSIDSLLISPLDNLRTINLDKTFVSEIGIEKLLLGCTNLEKIGITETQFEERVWAGKPDTLIGVLEGIANDIDKMPKFFKIKTYISDRDKLNELGVIVQMCPLIQNLTIRHLSTVIDDSPLNTNILAITGLKGLRELTLQDSNMKNSQLIEALQVIGCNLTHLHLLQVRNIDLKVLLKLSEMCPNLQSLSLENCPTFILNSDVIKSEPNIKFTRLTKLKLDTCYSFDALLHHSEIEVPEVMEYSNQYLEQSLKLIKEIAYSLLANCLNIQFIHVSESDWLSEDLFYRILKKNPLKYLKEMKIWQHPNHSPVIKSQMVTEFIKKRIVQNSMNRPQIILEKIDKKRK